MCENYENQCNCGLGEECEMCSPVQDILSAEDVMIPIFMDRSNVEFIEYDEKEVQRGIDNMSFLVGQITALVNAGIKNDEALAFIMNRENIDHNLKLAQTKKEEVIESGKHKLINDELNQI